MYVKMFLRKQLLSLGLIATLVLAACSSNAPDPTAIDPTPPAEGSFEVIGGTDEQLVELVTRLMSPYYPGAPTDTQVELFVGTLPDQLAFEIPLPTDTRLIGSMTTIGRNQNFTQVVMQSAASLQEVNDFYDAELADLGFASQEQPASGFVPQSPNWYCSEANDLFLQLLVAEDARTASNTGTEIQLHIQADLEYSPCSMENQQAVANMPTPLLPALSPPPGSVMRDTGGGGCGGGGGGGGCGTTTYTHTMLEAEQSLKELSDYFSVQLLDAGWEIDEESHTEMVSQVSWDLSNQDNEPMRGMLLVIPGPNYPDTKFIYLYVNLK
ncbi:MAG: hypothetical protein DWQ07_24155 [Chloroflexi bacterium]|nr:MAG: hypothetical protein DWQ07_24155 [Chloroflexota bacterium]MBL1196227.1 hypothetical protein [Chloroflexota bacterium]NOH13521.1 hypothetical protein [Chloroflexota bacterium]